MGLVSLTEAGQLSGRLAVWGHVNGLRVMAKRLAILQGAWRAAPWLVLAAIIVLGITLLLYGWTRNDDLDEQTVSQQWNIAIQKLGIEPVYPPEEDIMVGDIFAIISEDEYDEHKNGVENESLARTSIKIYHKDLSSIIDNDLAHTYLFKDNLTTRFVAAIDNDKMALPDGTSSSMFDTVVHRSSLPIATFPAFKIYKTNSIWTSASFNSFPNLFVHGSLKSDLATEVKIENSTTYGISALDAANALDHFCRFEMAPACSDTGLRKLLSNKAGKHIYDVIKSKSTPTHCRMKVEVGLINRVYLTQSIKTSLLRENVVGGDLKENLGGEKKKTASQPDATVNASSQTAGTVAPGDPRNTGSRQRASDESGADEASAGVSASDEASMAISFDAVALDRPVVFGYSSVRFIPDKGSDCGDD